MRHFVPVHAAFDTTLAKLCALSGISTGYVPLLTQHSAFRVSKAAFPQVKTTPLAQRSVSCVLKAPFPQPETAPSAQCFQSRVPKATFLFADTMPLAQRSVFHPALGCRGVSMRPRPRDTGVCQCPRPRGTRVNAPVPVAHQVGSARFCTRIPCSVCPIRHFRAGTCRFSRNVWCLWHIVLGSVC